MLIDEQQWFSLLSSFMQHLLPFLKEIRILIVKLLIPSVFFFCFFVFFNLWWSQIGDHHPQEELAKFGYMSKRKVEKNKNPAIFWWPAGRNLLSKYGDFQKSLPWDQATYFDAFFFTKILLYEFALEFFWVAKHGENLPPKKKEHYYVLLLVPQVLASTDLK
jgi:hypothetical protein